MPDSCKKPYDLVSTGSRKPINRGFSINILQWQNYFDRNAEGPNAQNRSASHPGTTLGACRCRKSKKGGHLVAGPKIGWFCVRQLKISYHWHSKNSFYTTKFVKMCKLCARSPSKFSILYNWYIFKKLGHLV